LALGVQSVRAKVPNTLWLVFSVKKGDVDTVSAMLHNESDVPDAVQGLKPAILAKAKRETWTLLAEKPKDFFKAVERGQVHVSGDFRVFGRYSPALLRLVQGTDIWKRLDELVQALDGPPKTKSK
jgi:hypothetical protein